MHGVFALIVEVHSERPRKRTRATIDGDLMRSQRSLVLRFDLTLIAIDDDGQNVAGSDVATIVVMSGRCLSIVNDRLAAEVPTKRRSLASAGLR